MKNLSTGFGLALLAGAILAYPFVSSLAPSANASAVTAAASAVSTAATGQTAPTIVWYGMVAAGTGTDWIVFGRAWSNGRIETRRIAPLNNWCGSTLNCVGPWQVVSDPAEGLTSAADLNFDQAVDGADLGQLLADWGNAPRQDIPPSDCPLALINP